MSKKKFLKKNLLSDIGAIETYQKGTTPMFCCIQNLEIAQNPTILDIGSNIGMFTLSYASMSKGAEIYYLEPVPFIYDYLN